MNINMVSISQFFKKQRPKILGFFNLTCVILLLFFVYLKQEEKNHSPFLHKHHSLISTQVSIKKSLDNSLSENGEQVSSCTGMYEFEGYGSKCEFLKDNPQCNSGGYFNYIKFFYCDCEKYTAIGYVGLGIWLVGLFYLLGNTATDYFCCSLEKLALLLRLPPTVAGVTLLPLGNGAPDVFASIAAFVGNDSGDVGLNGVLGGAVFVTCVVVGTVSLCVAEMNVRIDRKCFLRDVLFFLWTLVCLGAILFVGEIGVWGAIGFVSIYVVYASYVAATVLLKKRSARLRLEVPLLRTSTPQNSAEGESRLNLLESVSEDEVPYLQEKLPHWMWASHVAIYSNGLVKPMPMWGWNEEEFEDGNSGLSCTELCSWLELPLSLPRKLTIPVVEEDRWSKIYAVLSVSLAPLLLAFLWNTQDESNYISEKLVYVIGVIIGSVLGMLAFLFTSVDNPPRTFILPLVIGGFFMSIVWFYIVANELVALLVSFGLILGIDPAILSLTVLAWGNSMGDLMSNVSMAMNGGGDGVQIAMSGCYAGPMFNTLAGLGVSMLIGAWSGRPNSYVIPEDSSLYFTLGFLIFSLLWALFILPRNDMRPNKLLGLGLMVIYVVFLSLRAAIAIF